MPVPGSAGLKWLPTILDKLQQAYEGLPYGTRKDIEDFQNSLNAVPAVGAPVAMGGMVMNPKNAAKIAGKIRSALAAFGVNEVPNELVALQYVKNKYPLLYEKLANTSVMPTVQGGYNLAGDKILGGFNSEKNTMNLYSHGNDVKDVVDTLTHELTHSRQMMKDPIGLKTAYIPGSYAINKDYFGPGNPPELKVVDNFDPYKAQSWETLARKGGETGKATFEKFMSFIEPEAKAMDLNFTVDKDFINEYYMPALAERMKKDQELASRYGRDYADIARAHKSRLDKLANVVKYGQKYVTPVPDYEPLIYGGPITARDAVTNLETMASPTNALRKYLSSKGYNTVKEIRWDETSPAFVDTMKEWTRILNNALLERPRPNFTVATDWDTRSKIMGR